MHTRSLAWLASLLLLAVPVRAGADGPRLATPRAILDFSPPTTRSPEDSVLARLPHPWPGRAALLSLAGCAAPFAIEAASSSEDRGIDLRTVSLALTLLPATGHVYAGQPRPALAWSAVRAAGAAILLTHLESNGRVSHLDALTALAGLALVGGGAALEVLATPGDVARANRELAAARLRLGLAPARGGAELRLTASRPPP